MTDAMLGLRTTIYKVTDLAAAKDWYARAFRASPYFDEPFYVGFNIAGYELGLLPDAGLDHDTVLANTTWPGAQQELAANHEAMLDAGHWGVPLMAYEGEPFYGQDRFDQLLWRMGIAFT